MSNDIVRLRETLMNTLLWNDNEAILKRLEKEASEIDAFETDNGEMIKRRPNESLGLYIDRFTVKLMSNFSKEKFNMLKRLYDDYNKLGDSNLEKVEEVSRKKGFKKKVALGGAGVVIGATLFNYFKNKNKKK
ncbi:MAG: hypothetical protein ACRCVJ_10165 [Clostridium sp.]|uniref:hypothetical protein n=1 Tax=Clostridium sp. TaxID=1506 RepID=UPI003F2ED537